MKLNKKYLISALMCAVSLFGLPGLVSADDLKVSNSSKYDLTFSINDTCSGEFGMVDNHSVQIIPEDKFNKACAYNPTNCKVKVYSAALCTGKHIATVVFDTGYGVQALYPIEISLSGSGFNLFFEGPWQAKKAKS